jgi:hypothetical protein
MTDVIERGSKVVELLERHDASGVAALLSERVRGWPVESYLSDVWGPGLDELAGSRRRITETIPISETTVRFILAGEHGRAVVTIQLDSDGRLDGLALDDRVFEGIGTVVIACPKERREELDAFYAGLLGHERWRLPRLAFGEARTGYEPPQWPDPDHPQQLHLDLFVRDLDAAGRIALERGATLLQDKGRYRSYADPIGHPFCLYPEPARSGDPTGSPARLGRVVIDCFSPRALAPFYEALLGMPVRVEDEADRVVIGKDDRSRPMLGFQHVAHYVSPRWPDAAYPQQMHFDLKFDDRRAAQRLAERLGAIRLPDQGGSCPVYADPAGHPFCLCKHGE